MFNGTWLTPVNMVVRLLRLYLKGGKDGCGMGWRACSG
jgi:hypothetical protein